jgi:hypothetical protein
MYCPQCGGTNEDSARFCSTCGLDLGEYKQQWQETGTDAAEQPAGEPAGRQPAMYQQPPSQLPPYQQPHQQQYQPEYAPPYQAPQYYQTRPPYGAVPRVPSYMGWAIATLILCFWPTGIVAVVYASQVGNKLALGDITGAQESSRKAKIWCWVTFGIGIAWFVIAIAAILLAAAASVTVY